MNKFLRVNRFLGRYLIYASPLVVVLLIWSALIHPGQGAPPVRYENAAVHLLWEILGVHLLIWLSTAFYIFVVLLFSPALRDLILTRLARIKERDEREEFIVGRAARASWLSTLALMLFLLVVSGLHVRVAEVPRHLQRDGRRRSLSIGYGIGLLQRSAALVKTGKNRPRVIFSFSGTALSKSALLLILLFWHLLSFHLFSRKWSKQC